MKLKDFYPFLDPIGRVSEKPGYPNHGITDNPHLFTGEAVLLLSLLGKFDKSDMFEIRQNLLWTQAYPGLYRRHPFTFQNQYKIPYHLSSHDEYNGICFLSCAIPEFQSYAREIVNYGKKCNSQYNDLKPGANFLVPLLHSPLKTLKSLYQYYKDHKANPHNTNAVDQRHALDIVAVSTWRQPRDICFYKIAAQLKPSLFESFYLGLAIIFTSYSKLTHQNRGGTLLLAWFRMIAIKKSKNEPLMVKFAHWYFNRRLTSKFGSSYAHIISIAYFNNVGKKGELHPIRNLIKELAILDDK